MASQKDKASSLFFSSHLTQKSSDFLALYFDQAQWGQLFELVKEFTFFSLIKKNPDEFLLRIGPQEFNIIRDFHRCIITLGEISTLAPDACELLAKIADLVFYDRKHLFLIDSSNLNYEEMMWEACFNVKLSIKPANKTQAIRFERWQARKNIQNKTTFRFSQNSLLPSPISDQAKEKAQPLFFSTHFTGKKSDFLALYFDQDEWSQLFELVKEFDAFNLTQNNADGFLLTVGRHEFNVTHDFHRCIITLGQISTLAPGAGELLAKIADLIFYDRKQRFVIDSSNVHFEERIWEICFKMGIALKPANKNQAKRFQMWAARKNIQNKTTLGFSQNLALPDPNLIQVHDQNTNPNKT